MSRQIIFIGGAPTVGKSTMAQLLGNKLNLPWISTDQIRSIMRTMASPDEIPDLFQPKGFETAEKFLTHFTSEEIANLEWQQGEAVWPVLKNFIEQDYNWNDGFIVEGVNVLPHLIAEYKATDASCKAVFYRYR